MVVTFPIIHHRHHCTNMSSLDAKLAFCYRILKVVTLIFFFNYPALCIYIIFCSFRLYFTCIICILLLHYSSISRWYIGDLFFVTFNICYTCIYLIKQYCWVSCRQLIVRRYYHISCAYAAPMKCSRICLNIPVSWNIDLLNLLSLVLRFYVFTFYKCL